MSSVNNQLKEFLTSRIKSKKKIVISSRGASKRLGLNNYLSKDDQIFDRVEPNPNLIQLIEFFQTFNLDSETTVVAIGGGSVIDFSKLVALFFKCKPDNIKTKIESGEYRNIDSALKTVVIPTLYGSGAEQTPFAVCYIGSKKYSVSNPLLFPKSILYFTGFSESIPIKIKEANILDCFCQASESLTSINSNELSKNYAAGAVKLLVKYGRDYIRMNKHVSEIMKASELCGKAISTSKTTGPHALSYYLTSQHDLPHGKAVGLSFLYFLQFYLSPKYNNDKQLIDFFEQLCISFNCEKTELANEIPEYLDKIGLNTLNLKKSIYSKIDYKEWYSSINLERLVNGPQISDEDFNYKSLKIFIGN